MSKFIKINHIILPVKNKNLAEKFYNDTIQTSNYSKKGVLQARSKIRQLAKLGDQKVSLSNFVISDRENH